MADQTDEIRDRLLALLRQSELDRASLADSTRPDLLTGVAAYDQLIRVIRQTLDELEPPH